MAPWLRVLAETLGSVLNFQVRLLTTVCNSRDSNVSQNTPATSHVALVVYLVTPIRKMANPRDGYGLTVSAHSHSVTQARTSRSQLALNPLEERSERLVRFGSKPW